MVVWRYLDGEDREMGRSDFFDDQDEAEAWLTDSWRDLLADGVGAVELTDDDGERIYRMSLLSE
jgi:hypothetical protein